MNISSDIYYTPCYNKCICMDDMDNIISIMEDKLLIYNSNKADSETILSLDKEKLKVYHVFFAII